ncbi:hypothetical protein Scep_015943 [Stephania cephalantha]|uniref:Thioredoxin domain-containing protein n=1 Tax=Stephania cephalantha TaxID=152367 RepID=A0AAP0NU63_9MAGN
MATLTTSNSTIFTQLPIPTVRATSRTANCSISQLACRNLSIGIRSGRKLGFGIGFGAKRFGIRCGVTEIDETQFSELVLKSEKAVLVEFVATWCGPCRLISPAVDWATEEYKDKVKIYKIDHDKNPELIEKYKVYGLPTLILFKDGKEVPESRSEGAMTKKKLKDHLDGLLKSKAMT